MAHIVLTLVVLIGLLLGSQDLAETHIALANHCQAHGEILGCEEFNADLSATECNLAIALALVACAGH